MVRVAHRLSAAIRDAAACAPDSAAYRQAVLDVIRSQVPFDAACLGATDPATLVPTGVTTLGYDDPTLYATVVDVEYGTRQEPGSFASMARQPVAIQTIGQATGGAVLASRQYAELLAPNGLADEVRMIFRGRDGRSWGVATLARLPGREFGSDEVGMLGTILADVADGLRTMLLRDATRILPSGSDGPAIAVVGVDGTLECVTPAARDYFDRLAWGPLARPDLVAPALSVAAWLRHTDRDSVAIRARTRDGEWLVIRACWFGSERPPVRVVVTVEPARVPEIASVVALAHGLTPRETEVLVHVLAGRTRDEMARALFISPYTVQDHLKSIFAKTGVGSRRSLVAKLVETQYVPRWGTPTGPDGWFIDSTNRAERPGGRPW